MNARRFAPLAGLALLASCASPWRYEPYRTLLPHDAVECASDWEGVWPVVSARVDGEGPFRFVVDTGTSALYVSEAVADAIDAPRVGSARSMDASGEVCRLRIVGVDALTVDATGPDGTASEARFEHLRAAVTALPKGVDGLIGLRALGDCTLTLDYPARRVLLHRRPPEAGDGIYLDSRGGNAEVTLTIDGRKERFIVDSGSVDFISVNRDCAKRLDFETRLPRYRQLTGDGETPFWQEAGRLRGDLVLGAWRVRQPIITVDDGPNALGGDFLQRFIVTFDRENGRLILAGDAPQSIDVPSYRAFGLFVDKKGDRWNVVHVTPDSPAHRAGVRRGDGWIALDDQPVDDWTHDDIRGRVAAKERHVFRLRRDDEDIEIEIEKGILSP